MNARRPGLMFRAPPAGRPSPVLALRLASVALLAAAAGCGANPPAQPTTAVAKQLDVRKREEQPAKLLERGKAFAELGDNDRAEQYLSGALDGGADPNVVLPLLLRVCIAERRYRVAIDYAEPHLRRRPTDFRLRFVVASLYQSIGDKASARRELEQVMRFKPDHADAHYAMAVIFRDEEDNAVKADEHFREYLRLMPEGRHAEEARASLLRDATTLPRVPMKQVPPASSSTSSDAAPQKVPPKNPGSATAPSAVPAPKEVHP